MKYYIVVNNQPDGPYEVEELVAKGIKPNDLVWTNGLTEWVPASSVPEIASAAEAAAEAIPPVPAAQPDQQEPDTCPHVPAPAADVIQEPPAYPAPAPACCVSTPASQELPPKSWLIESILATIFCCIPFGIVGIIKASNVNSLWATGQFDKARKASSDAKLWTIISVITGLVLTIIYVIFIAASAIIGL